MKFRILGPLEVVGRAGPVHLLAARSHRSLLLALLSHPNEVVSVDRLQEWLWPDSLPRSAAATLQAHISVLRKLLEPDRKPWSKPSVLITRSPGYLIKADEDLDSLAFESLLTRARAAHDIGEFAAVRGLLRDALELWRGDALADVAFLDAAQPTIRRLQELRLSSLQLHNEAELILGRHRDVIPDLMRLISAHPVHEPFYWQLMLALYRSGRRADALGVYAQASAVLAREMALEPGPELRRLRDAIQSDGNAAS